MNADMVTDIELAVLCLYHADNINWFQLVVSFHRVPFWSCIVAIEYVQVPKIHT